MNMNMMTTTNPFLNQSLNQRVDQTPSFIETGTKRMDFEEKKVVEHTTATVKQETLKK